MFYPGIFFSPWTKTITFGCMAEEVMRGVLSSCLADKTSEGILLPLFSETYVRYPDPFSGSDSSPTGPCRGEHVSGCKILHPDVSQCRMPALILPNWQSKSPKSKRMTTTSPLCRPRSHMRMRFSQAS